MFIFVIIFIISSILLLYFSLIPLLEGGWKSWQKKKEEKIAVELNKLFYDKSSKEILRLYLIFPPLFSLLLFVFFNSLLFAIFGFFLGLLIPNFILKMKKSRYRGKFTNQILDGIMILSSCLKSGLSFLQALEVLTEESPPPLSQEVGLVLRENRMGVSLEDSLKHLDERMDIEELRLVINSILVARETGGDLTKVFSRLSNTIRDNRKLKESIKTLTLQGRLQGIIMSVLPFLFIWWVLTFNRQHFNIMFESEIGRMLLFTALILQALGMVLIRKFSIIRI